MVFILSHYMVVNYTFFFIVNGEVAQCGGDEWRR